MSSEKWVEYGWLRREPTSPREIKDLLGIVDRSLADSKAFPARKVDRNGPIWGRDLSRAVLLGGSD